MIKRDEFYVEFSLTRMKYGIGFIQRNSSKSMTIADGITTHEHEPYKVESNPYMLEVDDTAILTLMDSLWRAGVRPSSKLMSMGNDDEIKWLRETADHLMGKPK